MASRLTKQQRDEICYLRFEQKYSRREIWKIMWVDFTVLYKEVKRNRTRGWRYNPTIAESKTYYRKHYKKKESKKIRTNDTLENYIIKNLKKWRSPETVAWRRSFVDWSTYNEFTKISWISIRRYIESKYWLATKDFLKANGFYKKRRSKAPRNKREWGKVQHRTFIDKRPEFISKPTNLWHFECDFILWKKWEKDVIMTLIDKFSRFKVAVKLDNKESKNVYNHLLDLIKKLDIKSITFDNDTSFALHYKLGIETYFCHTYSSREKWQIEKWNVWYREFYPKWQSLKQVHQKELDWVSDELNDRPMACLWYYKPIEVWEGKLKNSL